MRSGTPAEPAVAVGISLKMYFGHRQTLAWCKQVADTARHHVAVTSGSVDVFVLPSFPSIPGALAAFADTRVDVGAQDLFWQDDGAFTGEVSGRYLREMGCTHVEVGHAERRRLFGEDDTVVAKKTAAALRNGLVPVVCVGEPERSSSDQAAAQCVADVGAAVAVARGAGTLGPIIVAYEPQWAIGAAEPAPLEHITRVCTALSRHLAQDLPSSRVIYGGSAGAGLLTELGGDVGGLFLGRAVHDPAALSGVLDEALAVRAR